LTEPYVGSETCKSCHADIYDRWKKTPMANVVRDPHQHPEAIIPDFSKPDPLRTFSKDDIALVYGSVWKQRYFKKVGSDYFAFPAHWDLTHKIWRPYFVENGADWWATLFPPRQFPTANRPALRWLPLRQLRRQDEDCDRMERRLRKLPWARRQSRQESGAADRDQPCAA
jgi:hypothetical protein